MTGPGSTIHGRSNFQQTHPKRDEGRAIVFVPCPCTNASVVRPSIVRESVREKGKDTERNPESQSRPPSSNERREAHRFRWALLFRRSSHRARFVDEHHGDSHMRILRGSHTDRFRYTFIQFRYTFIQFIEEYSKCPNPLITPSGTKSN